MREILFRGKRTDTGEWVYGYYEAGYTYENKIPFHRIVALDRKTLTNELAFVRPETVGQYTGLTDRNGTRIFEGDIVEMHGGCDEMDMREYNIRCMVVYGRTGYGADIGFAGAYKSGMRISLMCEGCLTVIGNIHDNPELLEG